MSHQRKFFITPEREPLVVGIEASLSKTDSHHLKNVLRTKEGAPVMVVDQSTGKEFGAFVASCSENVIVKLVNEVTQASYKNPVRSLTFSLCKNQVNDLVCEKAAELGVKDLLFWQSERSIVSVEPKDREKKLLRWAKISESASKQSGKSDIMQVSLVLSMSELFEALNRLKTPGERRLLCSLSPQAIPIRKLSPPVTAAHLLIGPPGDITEREAASLTEHGFEHLSLGANLLRAETAAIVSIAMVQAIFEG